MDVEQIERIYDNRAERYDRSVGFAEMVLLGKLRMLFGTALEGRVLEIGVGSGLNYPYYTDRIESAVGVDLSQRMLDLARRRADEWSVPVSLLQMDGQALAFPENTFDTVAISLALCTVPDPEQALREMMRVCRSDGILVFLEHGRSPNAIVYAGERLLSPLQERSWGCSLVRDTRGMIERAGLDIVTEYSRWFSIFRMVVARNA